jgi:hypothetical protein
MHFKSQYTGQQSKNSKEIMRDFGLTTHCKVENYDN